jgi:hypothetical protein
VAILFKQTGFVVLTTIVILSAVGIIYTVNMAHSQLMDNRVLGNYYRNNEALANAESGVSLILSKLSDDSIARVMMEELPFVYPQQVSDSAPYQVTLDSIASDTFQITSVGYSQDRSAFREVALQIYQHTHFDIPNASFSSNGQLSINSSAFINNGCEGLDKNNCRSPGNIAEQIVITPSSTEQADELCDPYFTNAPLDYESKTIIDNQWGSAASSVGSFLGDLNSLQDMENTSSLFQSTFGVTLDDARAVLANSDQVTKIDMTVSNALSCSEQLNDIDDQVKVIYIKGDCNIDQNDPSFNSGERFTIGSLTNPKMILIEGGTFTSQPSTGVSVNGLLYFIPAIHDLVDENGDTVYVDQVKQTEEDPSIDISGIRVNGALMSEYQCAHNQTDADVSRDNNQHLSIRYDKSVLNQLYEQLGMEASATYYQLVAGSWRDF